MKKQIIGTITITADENHIGLKFIKAIAKRAKQATNLDDLLLWVNDECELMECTHGQLCHAVRVAKHWFNN